MKYTKNNRIIQIFAWILFSTATAVIGMMPAVAQTNPDQLLEEKIVQVQQPNLTAAQVQTLANELERIALVRKNDWYAQYYAAYAYIELANKAAKREIDNLCDRAQEFLDKAISLRPEESENHVLKAYLLSARINVNAMFRGAGMGRDSKTELDRALELNPNNPRAHYVRAMGIYFTPAVFGGGKTKAKPHLDTSLRIYRNYPGKTPIDPHWGQKAAEDLLATY